MNNRLKKEIFFYGIIFILILYTKNFDLSFNFVLEKNIKV